MYGSDTVLLDLTAPIADSFEGGGAYSRGLLGGFTVFVIVDDSTLCERKVRNFYSSHSKFPRGYFQQSKAASNYRCD